MSRLDIAAERFNEVLQALEEAVAPLSGLKAETVAAQAKISELSEEREQLGAHRRTGR